MAFEIEAIRSVAGADPGPGTPLRASGQGMGDTPSLPRARGPEVPVFPRADDVGLVFEVNGESQELIIKIVNRETRQIIRELPPQEVQRMRAAMQSILGVVFDQTG
jgi:hypothetical protein